MKSLRKKLEMMKEKSPGWMTFTFLSRRSVSYLLIFDLCSVGNLFFILNRKHLLFLGIAFR